MIRSTILLILIVFVTSCGSNNVLKPKDITGVQDSVRLMVDLIARNVSLNGPVAWLRYFEDTPGFFMASGGQLVFPNNDSAEKFINNVLIKSIAKIELRWSNIRIDPLTSKFAVIAANFHEDITDSAGTKLPMDGYFTGIAHQTSQGWKLHNAHWSIKGKH